MYFYAHSDIVFFCSQNCLIKVFMTFLYMRTQLTQITKYYILVYLGILIFKNLDLNFLCKNDIEFETNLWNLLLFLH